MEIPNWFIAVLILAVIGYGYYGNDIADSLKSIPAISQTTEDKLVSDCRQDFKKYADIGESKTSVLDISIIKIEKITNNQTAKVFFELYGSGSIDEYADCVDQFTTNANKKCDCSADILNSKQYTYIDMACEYCCAYYKQNFPFVFIAAKREIKQNGITMGSTRVYICNGDGNISKWAKLQLIN